MNDRTSYTPEEFQAAIARIYESAAAGRTPQERPKAFLLGGQPGAGKSALLKLFSGFLQYDAVTVSGDDYRQSHPRFIDTRTIEALCNYLDCQPEDLMESIF